MSLSTLPAELLLPIASELSTASLNALTRTCHSLHFFLVPTLLHRLTLHRTADEALRWAITNNNIPTVNLALSSKRCHQHSHWLSAHSSSCVCLAIDLGHMEIAKLLIAHFAMTISSDIPPCHYAPLYYAILRDDTALVTLLLEQTDLDILSSSWTYQHPLVLAAVNGSVEMAELFIRFEADADPDVWGPRRALETALDACNWPYAKKIVQFAVTTSWWPWQDCPKAALEKILNGGKYRGILRIYRGEE